MEMTGLAHRLCLGVEGQRGADDDGFLVSVTGSVIDRCEEIGKVTHAGRAAGECALKEWIPASLTCGRLLLHARNHHDLPLVSLGSAIR